MNNLHKFKKLLAFTVLAFFTLSLASPAGLLDAQMEAGSFDVEQEVPGNKYSTYNQDMGQYQGLPFEITISNAIGNLMGSDTLLNGENYSVIVSYNDEPVGGGMGIEFDSGANVDPIIAVLDLEPGSYSLSVFIAGGDGTIMPAINKTETLNVELADIDEAVEAIDIVFTDDDIDKVYFPGDSLGFEIVNLPHNFLELTINFGVFTSPDPGSFKHAEVVTGLEERDDDGQTIYCFEDEPVDGKIFFSENVKEGIDAGVVGIGAEISLELGHLIGDNPRFPPNALMHLDKPAIVGVAIPDNFGDITSQPSFDNIENLYDTEQAITFNKDGLGSITFEPGLNIIDNREQLEDLEDFLAITYNEADNSLEAEVDTDSLTFLAGHGAVIQFFGAMEKLDLDEEVTADNFLQFLDIGVFDNNDNPVSNLAEYFDINAVDYDAVRDILVLPVNHFTRYSVGVLGFIYGDVELNGKITVGDAILLLRHIVGLTELGDSQLNRAKVSDDGNEVNVSDAILILRYIVGLIPEFPVEQSS